MCQFLADHRNHLLTHFFLTASFFGSANFYVILHHLLYVAWDKRLAIRLSVLVLLTMAFNDLLKLFIKNPAAFHRATEPTAEMGSFSAEAKSLAR